jgi:Aflatoxin regulatory protein
MTRRAGRKKFSGTQPASQKTSSPVSQNSPGPTFNWSTVPISSAQNSQQSPSTPTVGYQDMFLGDSSVVDPTGLISTTFDSNITFNEYLTSPISLSTPELPDLGDLTESFLVSNNFCDSIDMSGTATSQPANNTSVAHVKTTAIPEVQLCFPSIKEVLDDRPSHVDGLHLSLTRSFVGALGLLRELPSPSPPSSRTFNGQSTVNHYEPNQQNTVQSIITGNEQAIQALSEILESETFEDRYFLAILSIVTLKVLASYAVVVRQMPALDGTEQNGDTSDHERLQNLEDAGPPALVDYFTDNEDQCRMTAQQILRQLHRVQRLVNSLSKRFKIDGKRSEASDTSSLSSASSATAVDSMDAPLISKYVETMFPFPRDVLKQLEADLRERLRKLSAEVVDILR